MVPNYTSISELLELLPGREELFTCLEVFQRRAQSCSFPHTPDEVTRREVERFLNDAKRNAERCPDMLALIFITLANGLQLGQNDLDETQWSSVATAEESRNKSDAYRKSEKYQQRRHSSVLTSPIQSQHLCKPCVAHALRTGRRFLESRPLS